jgi:UDP-N-acetyl-D-glucosamine 2-epimerase, UDP-hydrolysing
MKVHYVTGSRADFGLMQRCLQAIHRDGAHELGIVVTGQHMNAHYGDTAREVRDSGLPVVREIPVQLAGQDGAQMATALADELSGFVETWRSDRPDLVLVLGDRGEMLAATIAAVHLGIFVAHIHGGELSGTLDESFRHAISKLAHFHLVATVDAARRLERMGERPEFIHVIGAPGLVGLTDGIEGDRTWLSQRFGFPADKHTALVVFHPVVQEAEAAGDQIRTLMAAIRACGFSQIILRPNSDAGGRAIDAYLDSVMSEDDIRVETHLDRETYLRLLASCDLLVGNSSSGIIESASFGIPCVNVGSRQNGRLRNANTIDVADISPEAIKQALRKASMLQKPFENLYGDGSADRRLLELLPVLPLQRMVLSKQNTY